jgi:excinuclease ABC subunit A
MQKISLFNVHQNNLQIKALTIPLKQLVVFVGPSGSGKSSLAIDTLLAEGQRRCIEALRASLHLDDKRIPRPKVDLIEGLPPTFGMRQDIGLRFGKHTTLADLLGVQTLLEHLFLDHGTLICPDTGEAMKAFTTIEAADYLLMHHKDSACHIVSDIPFSKSTYKDILEELMKSGHTRIQYNEHFPFIEDAPTKPPTKFGVVLDRLKVKESNLERLIEGLRKGLFSHQQQVDAVLKSKDSAVNTVIFSSLPMSKNGTRYSKPNQQHLQCKSSLGACSTCQGLGYLATPTIANRCSTCFGNGLGQYANMLKIQKVSFAQAIQMSPTDLLQWLHNGGLQGGEIKELQDILISLVQVHLHNPLCQKLNSLSTGERSRSRTCAVLNQKLGQCLYVLDEPSLGLDTSNVKRLIELIRRKIKDGQSFVVVDHHPLFQQSADRLIHFGPGSGIHGGRILESPELLTTLQLDEFTAQGFQLLFKEQTTQLSLYQGALHILTGPSGSGKSVLIQTLYESLRETRTERILFLNNLGSLGNKRSILVTIAGMWSPIRTLLASTRSAKLHRLSAADFSFNRKGGRCETCHGIGSMPYHVAPLPPTEVTCSDCMGKRFLDTTLQATYRDLNVSDILNLTIDKALKIFEHQPILYRICLALQMVGLGYLTLGQTSPTLSGGEHSRIQLAQILAPCLKAEYAREPMIVLMDDPTAALHASDAIRIQRCLLNFRREGITMVLTSNNQQMLDIADYTTVLS